MIPASVTSIDTSAFIYCPSLTSINVDPLNNSYCSLDGYLFNRSQTVLVRCPAGKTGSVTIPNTVITLGSNSFYNCSGLTSITIPNSITSVSTSAFCFCGGLTSITIPASISNIGDSAFYSCTNLKSAYFFGRPPSNSIGVFDSAATGFTVYYFNDKTGFTSPTWQGYAAVNMGNSTPAATWLLANNLPYNADLQSDPNGDGVSLLMAYALNLDPKQNLSGSMPKPVIAGNQMSLKFYAGSAGVTYSVQSSTNLQTWSTTGVTLSNPDANNFRTATVNQSGPKRFLRIVAGY